MKKDGLLLSLLTLFTLLAIVSMTINFMTLSSIYSNDFTGADSVEPATVALTQAGAAGIALIDNTIDFGNGFYNGTCFLNFSILNSNTTNYCWVNTTTFPYVEDIHVIENTGSTVLNVTAEIINLTDAEEFFCDSSQGCTVTDDAKINLAVKNNEVASCLTNLNTTFQTLATNVSNFSISLCDRLGFADSQDTIKSYVELILPRDSRPGNKTMTVNYVGISV